MAAATFQSPPALLPSDRHASFSSAHLDRYPRGFSVPMADFDYRDDRYPSSLRPSMGTLAVVDQPSPWGNDDTALTSTQPEVMATSNFQQPQAHASGDRMEGQEATYGSENVPSKVENTSRHSPQPSKPDVVLSNGLPPGAAPARRVTDLYDMESSAQAMTTARAAQQSYGMDLSYSIQDSTTTSVLQVKPQTITTNPSDRPEHTSTPPPSTPRQSSVPGPGIGSGYMSYANQTPIVPLSTTPAYDTGRMPIPISPSPRAPAHQPTYMTAAPPQTPVRPMYSTQPPEEVCIECAMRDQDMADVDVTSPGVWDRESDVAYVDLLRREQEDDTAGVLNFEADPSRPRARGTAPLSEANLKLWQSMNPREPSSRWHTMELYVKSQRTLLEAEALAHARAMKEARQIDSRMRDAYSQLRRSAYDTGASAAPIDDTGGVRIKSPSSPTAPGIPHLRSHSREVTLLENGMIVEHVDVRREEKEERDRRRREEKRERSRARKSSRASGVDMRDASSMYSNASASQYPDPTLSVKPGSRYSLSNSTRPTSVITTHLDGPPSLPRALSQASFSDVHSVGSASPRRTRFFGFSNLSSGFRSQHSLAASGISGSMVDMHVALQREGASARRPTAEHRSSSLRRSQMWMQAEDPYPTKQVSLPTENKQKKMKNGLGKIWRIFTGHQGPSSVTVNGEHGVASEKGVLTEKTVANGRGEDDFPLAPPPPLSQLVNGRSGDIAPLPLRHASTPSLGSAVSPKTTNPISPGISSTATPRSISPSPTSVLRPSPIAPEANEVRKPTMLLPDIYQEPLDPLMEEVVKVATGLRNLHSVTSEPDFRGRSTNSPAEANNAAAAAAGVVASPRRQSTVLTREKSLPPLPGEARNQPPPPLPDPRPRTMYTYTPQQMTPDDNLRPPSAPFVSGERRQSFGGVTSRPNIQTLPSDRAFGADRIAKGYNEFGIPRQSFATLDNAREDPMSPRSLQHKRKSKFGISTLLGRKSRLYTDDDQNESGEFTPRPSDLRDDFSPNGHATSASRHSNLRVSVTSRKALQELVEQDPEFVAYRYPSSDQQLDLLR